MKSLNSLNIVSKLITIVSFLLVFSSNAAGQITDLIVGNNESETLTNAGDYSILETISVETNGDLSIINGTFSNLSEISVKNSGEIFITGGMFPTSTELTARDNGMITIFGLNFSTNETLFDKFDSNFGTISGTFSDGENFSFNITKLKGNGSILLSAVPEPSTYAMIAFALGLVFTLKCIRKNV